jgi:hypothetical protein
MGSYKDLNEEELREDPILHSLRDYLCWLTPEEVENLYKLREEYAALEQLLTEVRRNNKMLFEAHKDAAVLVKSLRVLDPSWPKAMADLRRIEDETSIGCDKTSCLVKKMQALINKSGQISENAYERRKAELKLRFKSI